MIPDIFLSNCILFGWQSVLFLDAHSSCRKYVPDIVKNVTAQNPPVPLYKGGQGDLEYASN